MIYCKSIAKIWRNLMCFLSHGKALAFSAQPQNYWWIRDKKMCYKCQTLQKFCYLLKILPSYIGTVCETPSPESNTIPVVLPEAYKDRTAWMATYIAGVLKVSNIICNRNNRSGTNQVHFILITKRLLVHFAN